MKLKVSSLKPGCLSPPACVSDPEEKEISDEDDDDRNHKHRRRDTRSQSLERDSLEPVFTRPYRKFNKPFENGHPFRENESQASKTWRNYNPLERDFNTKFEKRRAGLASLPRGSLDLSQRMRPNQTFSGDPIPGRGRGRDPGSWSHRDSRFSSVDIASQMVHQGSIAPNLFAGRGLPNVPNAQHASWNAFGLIPGMPNGGLDTLHPIGLQATLRPALNSSLNMGIPRQRCRDFEERGFCLRGDVCPMEHGVNRIVVEDVQSLSQFNLPVSLPSAQVVGTTAGPGTLSSVGASSTALMNNKGIYSKSSKPGSVDDGLGFNGAYPGSAGVGGSDLYDPDQPLWNNNGPGASTAILALHSPKNDENESSMSVDPSERHLLRSRDGTENEYPIRSSGVAVGPQSTSSTVWGRIGASKNRLDLKEKTDPTVSTSGFLESETKEKEDQDAQAVHGTIRQGKRITADDSGPKNIDSSGKVHSDAMRNIRKPSQKALRTLFVNGIPQKSNKRENLLSHFQKFGQVIDIYIPLNSERAFVQFSKREEAEAALRAPDAVMGNRFIKLWWANRDSIPDDGISSSTGVSVTPRGVPIPPHPSMVSSGKDNLQSSAPKGNVPPLSDASAHAADHSKLVITNGPKVQPPLQKKLESLEQLKEELRKKQELLDQKRNDFRRQLDKLEKQATVVKGEAVAEPAVKRHKVGIVADVAKATNPSSSDPGATVASPGAEVMVDKNKPMENVVSSGPKMNMSMVLQEPIVSKHPIRPLALGGPPSLMNRYKLDNRPTTFRIIPPLPAGLANVAALKEFFSSFGDVATVELEDGETCDGDESEVLKICSAIVTFTTRRSAERAFQNGKCWEGNNLTFMWVTSSISGSDTGVKENSSAPKCPMDADVQSVETLAHMDLQDASASGNGEPEISERTSGSNHVELQEVFQPYSASISSEESPKGGPSSTSMSTEEESLKRKPSPTAMSGESESTGGVAC